MNKFKKATKRIVAVGTSALLLGSAAFAASDLGDYPSMFVKDGKFSGQIVVGAAAAAADTTSATSIIDDLKAEFSGQQDKVKLTYKKTGEGGSSLSAIRSNRALNYNETIGNNSETGGFDDGDSTLLSDITFDNGLSDEDYEQKLILSNGLFNYALRDDVEGVTEIADGIYYDSDDTFAIYQIDFKTAINLSSSGATSYTTTNLDDDMIGRELTIMGNEFTIGDITRVDGSGDLNKIVLIGGSDKLTISEDEGAITKTIDGKSYEIEILSVSDDKVLLAVNGESKSIDEYDTEDIGGITIAVTDLASSSRDAKAGYAEIVVGGQKVTLEDGAKIVKINDEDVDDIYEAYEVYTDFSDNSGLDVINVTYKVSDDTLLVKGDSLSDVLFNSFRLEFTGTNNPTYKTIKLSVADDDINIDGTLENGNSFDRDFVHTTSTDGTDGDTYIKGSNDNDRIFHKKSLPLGIWNSSSGSNGIFLNGSTTGTMEDVWFNFTESSIKGSGIFLYDDAESQYLYEISSIDSSDKEVDVDEILDDQDKQELTTAKFLTDLEKSLTGSSLLTNTLVNVTLSSLGNPILAFKNELLMNFAYAEANGGPAGNLTFYLDSGDVDVDTVNVDDDEIYNVTLRWDSSEDEFNLFITNTSQFVNYGYEDVVDGSTDVKEYVTPYGTKIKYDNDENTYIHIMVPSSQVAGKVNVVFGGTPATENTMTIAADMVDDKVAELEEEGYIIISRESIAAEEVEFDVTSVATDATVTSSTDAIVVGGPAVNRLAADLLGVSFPAYGSASGVSMDEAMIKYYSAKNAVLVYGYEAKDTAAAVNKLNGGGLSGITVNVQ